MPLAADKGEKAAFAGSTILGQTRGDFGTHVLLCVSHENRAIKLTRNTRTKHGRESGKKIFHEKPHLQQSREFPENPTFNLPLAPNSNSDYWKKSFPIWYRQLRSAPLLGEDGGSTCCFQQFPISPFCSRVHHSFFFPTPSIRYLVLNADQRQTRFFFRAFLSSNFLLLPHH